MAIAKLAIETGLWVNYEMLDGTVTKVKKVVRKPGPRIPQDPETVPAPLQAKEADAEIAAIQTIADKNAEKYGIDIKIAKKE